MSSYQSSLEGFRDEIMKLRAAGLSQSAIARHLAAEYGVPATHQSVGRLVEHELQVQLDEMTEEPTPETVQAATTDHRHGATYPVFGNWTPTSTSGTYTYVVADSRHTQSVFADPELMREYEIKVPKPRKSQLEWGYGGAKLVAPAGHMGDAEIVVFLSDIHFPYQDDQLVQSSLDLIREVHPDRVVLNGDLADFFQLSRFNHSMERLDNLQEEIDLANGFRRDVRKAAPDAVIDETEGNHDSRIRTFVQQHAKALHTLEAIKPDSLFLYKELGIDWHPGAGFLLRKEFLVKHGTIIRGECPATAKAELQQAGVSGLSAHTHRLGSYRRAGYVQRQWTEQGCLCRRDPDYVVGVPNWIPGCVVGEFSYSSDAFRIHEIPAVEGELRLFKGCKA